MRSKLLYVGGMRARHNGESPGTKSRVIYSVQLLIFIVSSLYPSPFTEKKQGSVRRPIERGRYRIKLKLFNSDDENCINYNILDVFHNNTRTYRIIKKYKLK